VLPTAGPDLADESEVEDETAPRRPLNPLLDGDWGSDSDPGEYSPSASASSDGGSGSSASSDEEHSEIIDGPRKRVVPDYVAMNDAMFGGETSGAMSDMESDSDFSERGGKARKRVPRARSDAKKHKRVEQSNRPRESDDDPQTDDEPRAKKPAAKVKRASPALKAPTTKRQSGDDFDEEPPAKKSAAKVKRASPAVAKTAPAKGSNGAARSQVPKAPGGRQKK
jgi:septal ring-binding cell division protein DamX